MSSDEELESALVDTNIFVYAHDPSDVRKQALAIELIELLASSGDLIVSVQVLNEFYARATRPDRAPGFSHDEAAAVLRDIASASRVQPLTWTVTARALEGIEHYRLSLWDSLIWAVARENDVRLIYTEDMPGTAPIDGVRYVNPFETPP